MSEQPATRSDTADRGAIIKMKGEKLHTLG